MKKTKTIYSVLALTSAFLLIAACVFAKSGDSGKLRFSKNNLNLGVILPGEIRKFNFQIKNTGSKPFHIDQIDAGCPSCTQTKIDKMTIPAGGTAAVQVTFDSTGYDGSVNKTITFLDKAKKEYVFNFTAQIQEIIKATPRILNLKSKDIGAGLSSSVKLENKSGRPLRILKVTINGKNNDFIKVVRYGRNISPGSSTTLHLMIRRPKSKHRFVIRNIEVHTNYPLSQKGKKKHYVLPLYISIAMN